MISVIVDWVNISGCCSNPSDLDSNDQEERGSDPVVEATMGDMRVSTWTSRSLTGRLISYGSPPKVEDPRKLTFCEHVHLVPPKRLAAAKFSMLSILPSAYLDLPLNAFVATLMK